VVKVAIMLNKFSFQQIITYEKKLPLLWM